MKQHVGHVDYEVAVGRRSMIFHVNTLKQWHEAVDTNYWVGCVNDEYGKLPVRDIMKRTGERYNEEDMWQET